MFAKNVSHKMVVTYAITYRQWAQNVLPRSDKVTCKVTSKICLKYMVFDYEFYLGTIMNY